MKEWQKKYDVKVSGKRGRGRPRLTFQNIVSKVQERSRKKHKQIFAVFSV